MQGGELIFQHSLWRSSYTQPTNKYTRTSTHKPSNTQTKKSTSTFITSPTPQRHTLHAATPPRGRRNKTKSSPHGCPQGLARGCPQVAWTVEAPACSRRSHHHQARASSRNCRFPWPRDAARKHNLESAPKGTARLARTCSRDVGIFRLFRPSPNQNSGCVMQPAGARGVGVA